MHKSMRLEYEPASVPLHISVEWLFSNDALDSRGILTKNLDETLSEMSFHRAILKSAPDINGRICEYNCVARC
jgi:hypothetical protein